MLNSLKDIFSKLTPTNINDIPLIKIAQSIFIDAIERNSKVAKRITNIFDVQERNEDSNLINNAKRNLKEGLYQTYLAILFKYLKSIDVKKTHAGYFSVDGKGKVVYYMIKCFYRRNTL